MDKTLYDRDFYQWLTETAFLLAEGRLSELDVANLIDEIESMGKSQKRAIESYLNVLWLHLLKWSYQPEHRSGSWKSSIRNSRRAIQKRLQESPSLRSYPETIFGECYALARENAADERELPLDRFPETPPLTIEQVLDEEFWP